MKNVTFRLLTLIKEEAHNPCGVTTPSAWQDAYCEFRQKIVIALGYECSPGIIRRLDWLRIEFEGVQKLLELQPQANPLAQIYCIKAIQVVSSERSICTMKLCHPGFGVSAPTSELMLNDSYHATDLVELIAPLFELKVFKTTGGGAAKLKTIICVFEHAFNVSLTNYDMLRSCALNRKIHLTHFLDTLRDTLTEMSQR